MIERSYAIGGDFVNTTTAQTGRWNRIVVVKNNTKFDSITAKNWSGNDLAGESLPVGFEIHGVFTGFKLDSSGAVIAYRI